MLACLVSPSYVCGAHMEHLAAGTPGAKTGVHSCMLSSSGSPSPGMLPNYCVYLFIDSGNSTAFAAHRRGRRVVRL